MSLSALFCGDHFYGTDQNCFQDLGGNGLNQMGCKTSAFTFSHIRLTAPSTYGDWLAAGAYPPPAAASEGPNRFRLAAEDHSITSQIGCQMWQPHPRLPVCRRQLASDSRAPEETIPYSAVYHRDLRLTECAKSAGIFDNRSLALVQSEMGT